MLRYLLGFCLCIFVLDVKADDCKPQVHHLSPTAKKMMEHFRESIHHRLCKERLTPDQARWMESCEHDIHDCQPTRVRKEYRQMTNKERKDFHDAVHAMQKTMVDNQSQYHLFVSFHNPANAPYAHFGHSFLAWHREYLYRFENALRQHRPYAFIPYWDNTLDKALPSPEDTCLWNDVLMGDKTGDVTTGTFANWPVTPNCSFSGSKILRRDVISGLGELLFEESDITRLLGLNTFNQLQRSNFEDFHGGPHGWIGEHMGDIPCSPSDPIFHLHHAFVDYIWEAFRETSQTTPLTEYSDEGIPASDAGYKADSEMKPFGIKNRDGVRTEYTRCHYTYANRPFGCSKHRDCGNLRFLWCHRGRCNAKVNVGGNCTGLPNVSCFSRNRRLRPICKDNKCIQIPIKRY